MDNQTIVNKTKIDNIEKSIDEVKVDVKNIEKSINNLTVSVNKRNNIAEKSTQKIAGVVGLVMLIVGGYGIYDSKAIDKRIDDISIEVLKNSIMLKHTAIADTGKDSTDWVKQ